MMALEKLRCVPVHLTVWTVVFAADRVKITVDTVKCTGTYRNFFSATINYPSAAFSMYNIFTFITHTEYVSKEKVLVYYNFHSKILILILILIIKVCWKKFALRY